MPNAITRAQLWANRATTAALVGVGLVSVVLVAAPSAHADTNPDHLSSVTIASTNTNPAYAAPGDVVTLSFSADPSLGLTFVDLTVDGHEVPATKIGDAAYTAAYTLVATDPAGPVAFNLQTADKFAEPSIVTHTTDSSSVTFEPTAPVLLGVNISSDDPADPSRALSGDTVTLTFAADEDLDTVAATLDGHPVTPSRSSYGSWWSASWVVSPTDANGPITLSITAGDRAYPLLTATATTDGSFVDVVGNAPPPPLQRAVVASVSPKTGPTAGGQTVVITGRNVTGATRVVFGQTRAGFTVVSDTEIDATSPAHGVGKVFVRVHTVGLNTKSAADIYRSTP